MPNGANCLIEPGNLVHATGFIVGARSGLMTGIAADADVYALRNPSPKPIRVPAIKLAWVTTVAASADPLLGFALHKVTGFSAIHSGGAPLTVSAATLLRNAGHIALAQGSAATNDFDCRIADAGAMSTATYDATSANNGRPFDMVAAEPGMTPSAANVAPSLNYVWRPEDGLPLVLDQNEGIIIRLVATMGTALVGRLFVGPKCHRS